MALSFISIIKTDPDAKAPEFPGWHVLAVLSMLMGFASISTDLYLPAIPAMSRSLHADTGMIELTISSFLIGFSLGQLLWGPIADRYGRRPSVAVGLVLFVIGSAGCALANGVVTMIGWRIIQAIGACACVVLSRAMVRDLYEGNRAAQVLSMLITVTLIAPLVGPLVGGQIVVLAGWRVIFWTLVGIGIVTLVALFSIPETLPSVLRNRESLGRAVFRYTKLLRYRRFLACAGAVGFLYGGIFAYVAGTPFTYITYYKVPTQLYGLLFGLGVVGIMAVNILNSRLVPRFGYDRLLVIGTIIAALFALMTAAAAGTGYGGLWGLVVPLLAFVSSTGFIVANSITGALADFPEQAGTVSALIGAIQYGSGVVGSGLVGACADGTPWPMGWVIATAGIGSLLAIWLLTPSEGRETE